MLLITRYKATAILTALNAAVFIARQLGADGSPLNLTGATDNPLAVVSYMFSHVYTLHFAANMIVLIFAGGILESRRGPWSVLLTYVAGGIAGGLLYAAACSMLGIVGTELSGASAATLALCAATLVTTPAISRRLKDTPAALTGMALIVAIILLGFRGSNPGGALAHLGGIVAGIVAGIIMSRKRPVSDPTTTSENPIIEKVRRSGYASLSPDERRGLRSSRPQNNG